MKKSKNVLIGIFCPLSYYFVLHLMLLWEYNEKYAIIQDTMLYVLPALPGVALAILLVRNSLKGFLKAWSVCFLSSVCVFFIWTILRIDFRIYTSLTGFEEIGLGGGLLIAVMFHSYIASCTIGSVIAAIVSFYKQKKSDLSTALAEKVRGEIGR